MISTVFEVINAVGLPAVFRYHKGLPVIRVIVSCTIIQAVFMLLQITIVILYNQFPLATSE